MKTSSPSPRTQIARLKRLHEEELLRQSDQINATWDERMANQRSFFELELASRDMRITDLLIQIEEGKDVKKPSLWASAKSWWETLRWTFRNP